MTMINPIGTFKWSRRTGGKLSRKEREAFLKAQVARQVQAIALDQLPGITGSDHDQARMDIDTIRIPDSSVARHAETLVAELSPPFLTNHRHRTYLWGSLLAQHCAIRMDEELLPQLKATGGRQQRRVEGTSDSIVSSPWRAISDRLHGVRAIRCRALFGPSGR